MWIKCSFTSNLFQENGFGASWSERSGNHTCSECSWGKVEQCVDWCWLLQRHEHPVLWHRGRWQTHLQHIPVLSPCSPVHSRSPQSATEWVSPLNSAPECITCILAIIDACAALFYRQGVGALCDGTEQVSDSGVGLFDDETQLICCGCHWASATAPLHPAEPRLPEAAQSAGHHVARREAEARRRNTRAGEDHLAFFTSQPINILFTF